MAELAPRNGAGRSSFGDVFGFDPFRSVFPSLSAGLGFEVSRVEDGYKIELPVAGFSPEQIEVTVEDRVVTVSGRNERRNFTRSLVIPEEIDAENIGASVEHGLLSLALHVHPKAQPRKIAIKTAAPAAANPAPAHSSN